MSRRALLLLLFCALTAPATAAGFGTVAGLLMAQGLAVRPMGQADAWTARAAGDAGQQSNPAALAAQDGLSLGGGEVLGLFGDRMSWLNAGLGLGPGWGLGFQAAYAGAEDTARGSYGQDLGTFTDRQWLAGLGLAGSPARGWSLGLSVKGLQESLGLAPTTSLAVAGDLGLQGPLGGGRRFGVALLNAGSQIGGDGLPTPLRVRLGASTPLLTPRWQAEADLEDLPNEAQARLLLGSELDFQLSPPGGGLAAYHGSLRLGGQFGLLLTEDPIYSLGAGLGVDGAWDLDYALQSQGVLGLVHRFSLTLHFAASAPAPGPLAAPYGLRVQRRIDGLVIHWRDDDPNVRAFNLYSDYGVLAQRLNPSPVAGHSQRFVKVTPSRTYNFYVRAVGPDGQEGPPSNVLMWVEP